jgi:hypothetical protein
MNALPFVAAGGRGYSDHVSALCVALDLFKKAVKNRSQLGLPRVKRRVLLISTFDSEVWCWRHNDVLPVKGG